MLIVQDCKVVTFFSIISVHALMMFFFVVVVFVIFFFGFSLYSLVNIY